MPACNYCEVLPETDAPPETGTLYLAPPLIHTEDKLRRYFLSCGIPYSEPSPSILAVPLAPGRLQQMSNELVETLDAPEILGVKSLLLPEGAAPALGNLMQMQPLETLLGRVKGGWLIAMLRENRLVTHFQPIVSTQNPNHVFAYEALLRGRQTDGQLVPPSEIFGVALAANLLNQLERAGRAVTVRAASEAALTTKVFINFNPATIYDPVFCLRSTLNAIAHSHLSPEQIVFEVIESTEVKDTKHLLRVLNFYRERGFQVALDDMGAGYSSLNLMTKLKPDYIKLDLELIHCVNQDPYKAQIASKLLELAQSLGLKTIAEGIENEGEWEWARAHGADYVQGFLFARPAFPPPVPVLPPLLKAIYDGHVREQAGREGITGEAEALIRQQA